MMAGQIGALDGEGQGIASAIKVGLRSGVEPEQRRAEVAEKKLELSNQAGKSRSPYVRAHASNPVAWQLWGDEAIGLAKKHNRLLFVSIGYNACHCAYLQVYSLRDK